MHVTRVGCRPCGRSRSSSSAARSRRCSSLTSPSPTARASLIDVRAAGCLLPRGAADARRLPDQAGAAVRARAARWRASCERAGATASRPATAWRRSCMLGGFAEVALAPAHFTFRLPDALDFAQGAGLILNYHTAYFSLSPRAAAEPARPCSCTARRAASARRRCRWPRASARARSRSSPPTRRSAVAREAGADEVRARATGLEGRRSRRSAAPTSSRPGRRRPLHRQPALAEPGRAARGRRLHRRLDPRGQGQPPAAEQHRRRRAPAGAPTSPSGPR